MRRTVLASLLVLALLVAVVGCQCPETTPDAGDDTTADDTSTDQGLSGQLNLAGSTSVQPLAEELALAFMEVNPGVTVDVQGGGSSAGVTAAGEGTADIGNASRPVKDEEFETYPDIIPQVVAYDGIAVVVNSGVELDSLSIEQVAQIFAGEITNFSEVGGPDAEIIVISREEGSGTRDAFQDLVMEAGDEELLIADNAILHNSNGAVRTAVAGTENSIAFLSFGFMDDSTSNVSIDGVEPSVENVLNGTYTVYRPFNMITNGEPTGLAAEFLNFVLGAEGQEIVAEDYIPVE